MKIIKFIALGFLISLLFINITCDTPPIPDPEPQLPPITHEGKNTFGCLVNGKVWVAEVDGGFGMIHKIQTELTPELFYIDATKRNSNTYQIIGLSIYHSKIQVGEYKINNKIPGFAYYDFDILINSDSTTNGNIKITYIDTVNRIISGLFDFKLYSPLCDSIIIKDGRFDVKYPQ